MGQKVHPTGIRLGISKPWVSTWYANSKDFSDQLFGDHRNWPFVTHTAHMMMIGYEASINRSMIAQGPFMFPMVEAMSLFRLGTLETPQGRGAYRGVACQL